MRQGRKGRRYELQRRFKRRFPKLTAALVEIRDAVVGWVPIASVTKWGYEKSRQVLLWAGNVWSPPPLPYRFEEPAPPDILAVAEASHIVQLVEFGERAFPGTMDRDDRAQLYLEWLDANPSALRFLVRSSSDPAGAPERVGYTSVLPFKKAAYEEYRSGALSEYKIGGRHLIQGNYPFEVRYLCIQAFSVRKIRGKADLQMLWQGLVRHMWEYSRGNPDWSPVLIAEAETPLGRRVLERSGFAMINRSATDYPIYELDLRWGRRLVPNAMISRKRLRRLFHAYAALDEAAADPTPHSGEVE